MNYQRIYEQLTAKDMIADYTEKHHIIPRCMGGTNDLSNLVRLTPEAHYVAHQLLVKIYPDNHKLVYAVVLMTVGNTRNNKMYGWLKRKNSIAVRNSKLGKPRSPETKAKLSAINKGKIFSVETRAKMSAAKRGTVRSPETVAKMSASIKGKPQLRVICPHCNKEGGVSGMKQHHFNNCKQNGLPGQT